MMMIQRCTNPNDSNYRFYGARGIRVCDRWLDFANFREDMGQRPTGLSLDRIDTNGNYTKENCRWADKLTQANNTRTNHFVEFNGRRLTLAQWAREIGMSDRRLRGRFERGWTAERALTTP